MHPTKRHAYCGACGERFMPDHPFPRSCDRCEHVTYLNPTPVAVLLVPVISEAGNGLLGIRRDIDPGKGKVALPGGFMDGNELWEEACAREVREETGIEISASKVRHHAVHSTGDGMLLVFGITDPIEESALPAFAPTSETNERTIIRGAEELAFPLHARVVAEYFKTAQKG